MMQGGTLTLTMNVGVQKVSCRPIVADQLERV